MPDDILQFLCIHRPATLAFGAPAQEARHRVATMSRMIDASGKSRDYVRKDTEKSLRQNIEGGFHLDPQHQNEIAAFVMWLTMTSPAALESPNAQGFAIEFSNSPVSSQRPMDIVVHFIGPGFPTKDSATPAKAGRIVHYWTEPDGDAVVRLTTVIRQQVEKVRAKR